VEMARIELASYFSQYTSLQALLVYLSRSRKN